jgi:hypothetical protein
MRIAIIFPRFTGPFGGERLVLKLSDALSSLNNEVVIYTRHFDHQLESLKSKNVYVEEINNFNNLGGHQTKNILDMFIMPYLALRIRKHFDTVIGTGWQSAHALLWLIILKKIKKQNTIYYCLEPPRFLYDLKSETQKNNSTFRKAITSPIFVLVKYLDHASVRHVGKLISISDWTKNQCIKIYHRNSDVIQPGVEIERFQNISRAKARKLLKLNSKSIYLTVSKIHPRKMLKQSIDLYLKNRKPNSAYYLIGDGPYRSTIEDYINNNCSAKDNIHLLGRLPDQKVTLYMQAANYFIFTAKNEPFGIAPLEAQVAGCEVIPNKPKYSPNNWLQTARNFNKVLESQS